MARNNVDDHEESKRMKSKLKIKFHIEMSFSLNPDHQKGVVTAELRMTDAEDVYSPALCKHYVHYDERGPMYRYEAEREAHAHVFERLSSALTKLLGDE